jgi:collagen type III alpha
MLFAKLQFYRQTMLNLHKNHIPPGALNTLIPGNTGSPQSNPQQPQGGGPQFGPGGLNPGQQNKPMGGMMPPPPSPGMNKAQQQNTGKEGSMNPDSGNRPSESSPQTHSLTQPGGQNQGGRQIPQHQSIQQQSAQQSSSGQQSGSGTAPQTPVSNPATGMSNESVNSLLGNSQQQGSAFELFNSDLLRVVGEDFDPTKEFDPNGFLRADGGDLNFERDFGQWFNPDEMPLDLK